MDKSRHHEVILNIGGLSLQRTAELTGSGGGYVQVTEYRLGLKGMWHTKI